LLCSHARVNLAHVRDGFLSQQDVSKITNLHAHVVKRAVPR